MKWWGKCYARVWEDVVPEVGKGLEELGPVSWLVERECDEDAWEAERNGRKPEVDVELVAAEWRKGKERSLRALE